MDVASRLTNSLTQEFLIF